MCVGALPDFNLGEGVLSPGNIMEEFDMRDISPISLPVQYIVDYDDGAGVDMDQAVADVAVFIIPCRCTVFEAGVVVTETCAGGTTTPVVKFDKRATAGSDSGRGDGDIAHLVLSTTAQGKVMYDHVARTTELVPGEEVVVQLVTMADGTGAAGHIRPYLLVVRMEDLPANLSNMVETA